MVSEEIALDLVTSERRKLANFRRSGLHEGTLLTFGQWNVRDYPSFVLLVSLTWCTVSLCWTILSGGIYVAKLVSFTFLL